MRTLAIWLALHLPAPASWRPWMLGVALGRKPQRVQPPTIRDGVALLDSRHPTFAEDFRAAAENPGVRGIGVSRDLGAGGPAPPWQTLVALALLFLALPLAAQTQPDPFHLTPASGGGGAPGEGTVTSVGLAAPADLFSVSNSPVTDAGTLTLTKATAAANTCYAGPVSGAAAAPTFRLLVAADIPTPLTSDTSGNAGTASAAASNPGNCSAGNLPRGVSATWTAEGCAPVNLATESTGAAPTATALAVDPGNCGAGLLPRGVDAGGVAQGCAAVNLATESTGAAPTATALAANGTNCSATEAAIGVDASGNAEGCFTPAGGITGTGTDDHFMRWNGTTAAQDSDLVLADAAGSSVSVSTTPGNALALAATAPTATTGASQAGKAASLSASDAIASTDTAGAAAGGSVSVTAGAAARNTSGNANGGSIALTPGNGIGTGVNGQVRISTGSAAVGSATAPALALGTAETGLSADAFSGVLLVAAGQTGAYYSGGGMRVQSDGQYFFTGSSTDAGTPTDSGLKRVAAAVLGFTNGSSGGGWYQWSGQCRVAADQTNATTTFASTTCTISGLTAGRKYPFRCWFSLNQATAADGAKFDFQGGTAGETTFIASLTIYDTALALSAHPDDLTDSSAAPTLTGRGHAEVWGDFVPSGGGTFLPRFAQNAATTGTLTLHAGSWCTMDDSP